MVAPRLSLAGCVRGHIVRRTVGLPLTPAQRDNHFPASLLCAVNWFFEGEATVLRRGDRTAHEATPRLCLIGPHRVPVVSHNPGAVDALMVAFTPMAVEALTGVSMADLVDRVLPFDEVFDADWRAMAQAVFDVPADDAARIRVVEDFLEPRWLGLRERSVTRATRYRFWAETLALRAAQSGVGSSWRQVERRVKRWTGQPPRDLRRMLRAEESFYRCVAAHQAGRVDWAEAALDSGYADQAHLCREVRRITGLSPAALLEAVAHDEAFWPYRLLD
jgi:AraC-like DNA-binding protein